MTQTERAINFDQEIMVRCRKNSSDAMSFQKVVALCYIQPLFLDQKMPL